MEQNPSSEANRFQLVKKFPAFYRTRRFITAFTTSRHFIPRPQANRWKVKCLFCLLKSLLRS